MICQEKMIFFRISKREKRKGPQMLRIKGLNDKMKKHPLNLSSRGIK